MLNSDRALNTELGNRTVFSPHISTYHAIMEKAYGKTKAMEILGYTVAKKVRKPKICKLCTKPFFSRSQKKVYCGRQAESGTCSNKASQMGISRSTGRRKKLQEIYKKFEWLNVPELN